MNEITEDELKAIKNQIVIQTLIKLTENEINESSSVKQRSWYSVLAGLRIHYDDYRKDLKDRGIWVSDRGERQNDDIVTYRYAKRGHSGKFPLSKQGLKEAVEKMAEDIGEQWENAFRQRAQDRQHTF